MESPGTRRRALQLACCWLFLVIGLARLRRDGSPPPPGPAVAVIQLDAVDDASRCFDGDAAPGLGRRMAISRRISGRGRPLATRQAAICAAADDYDPACTA